MLNFFRCSGKLSCVKFVGCIGGIFSFSRFGVSCEDSMLASLCRFKTFPFRQRSTAALASLFRAPTGSVLFGDFCVTVSAVGFLILDSSSRIRLRNMYITRISRTWILIALCTLCQRPTNFMRFVVIVSYFVKASLSASFAALALLLAGFFFAIAFWLQFLVRFIWFC